MVVIVIVVLLLKHLRMSIHLEDEATNKDIYWFYPSVAQRDIMALL